MKISNSIKIFIITIFFFIGMNIADAKTFYLSYKSVDFSTVDVPDSYKYDYCMMKYNESSDTSNYAPKNIYVECHRGRINFDGSGIRIEISSYGFYRYDLDSESWVFSGNTDLYTPIYRNYCEYDDSNLYIRCDNRPNKYDWEYSNVLLAISININYKNSVDVYLYKDSYRPVYDIPWVEESHNVSFDVMYHYREGKRIKAILTISFDYIDNSLYNYDYAILGKDGNIYWEDIYPHIEEYRAIITFTKNTSIFVRITEKDTGELVKAYSYTIATLEEEIEEEESEGPTFALMPKEVDFCGYIKAITLVITFQKYNNNYIYEYSTDLAETWHIFDFADYNPAIDKKQFYIDLTRNTSVFIRITEKDTGELVKTYSYTITRINNTPCTEKEIDYENIEEGINSLTEGINSAHILYTTFYNNLSSEFKLLHNLFFMLITIVVVVKVVLK